jgi:hypothetical protein
MEYYDDNFGHYNIESDEDVAFYHSMQRLSVQNKRDYAYCNDCAEKRERGLVGLDY